MADKRISQLIERTDIANNDVLPIVASGATTTNKVTVSTLQDWMQDNLDVGVTSVGLSVPSAFTVSGSPVTTSGNITISGAGTTAQYIRGDGSLADFPSSIGGGGASVSYYLNGSVSQGTIGGVAYRELSKSPILGAGTDFTINADGYIASFITDAGDPSLLEIPGGNWNFETYFQASSGGGTPTFYVELYKVSSGGTATLIATSSGSPELIAFGTNITPYFSSLAVPTTTLALTDRLAIRYYVAHSGRTITLHTENNTLCQIITTFTTGLTALNGLTAQVQNFATGTSGTDFNISSASTTHTFNLPDASASNRGAVTTGSQVFGGVKTFANGLSLPSAGGSNQVTRLVNIGTLHEGSATLNQIGFNSANNIYFGKGLSNGGVLQWTNAAVRYYTLPDADGTLALASQLGAYLPLAGGTLTGALNGTSAVFSGDVQSGTRLIAAASSQSILLTPNSGGSTNRVESVGTLPLALVSAAAITMAAGGTTPQITLTTAGNVAIGTGSVTGAINADSLRANLILGAANSNKISFNNGSTTETGFIYNDPSETAIGYPSAGSFKIQRVGVGSVLTLASTGAATFSSSVTAAGNVTISSTTNSSLIAATNSTTGFTFIDLINNGASGRNYQIGLGGNGAAAGYANNLYFDLVGSGNIMTLTSGRNVGIGVVPSAWSGIVRGFQVALGASFSGNTATSDAYMTSNCYYDGSTWRYIKSGEFALSYDARGGTGDYVWQTAPSGTAGAALTLTERMRITSGGSVQIGTSSGSGAKTFIYDNRSNSTSLDEAALYVRQDGTNAIQTWAGGGANERMRITSGGNVGIGTDSPQDRLDVNGSIRFRGNTSNFTAVTDNAVIDYVPTSVFATAPQIRIASIGTASVGASINFLTGTSTSLDTRMSITSGGAVLIGHTATTYSEKALIQYAGGDNQGLHINQTGSTAANDKILFSNGNGIVGYIRTDGSATSYVTASDYRLKEDLQEINGLEKVSALKVYDFKWINSEDRTDGVLAHELAEVLPYAVSGEKDGDQMQGVDYSKIVPVLIKAVQELKAEIDSLKTK